MNTPYCVITDAGREIMRGVNVSGNTVKSDPFVFTKIMLGCGTYTAEQKTESALKVMTALRTPKNNYPISSVKRVNASNNLYKVSAIATNYNVATGTILVANGYNVTEIGIYARLSGGSEVLAAIAVIDEPDYMPGVDTEETIEGQIYQIVYDLYFGYSNVELDATIESSGAAFPADRGEVLEGLISAGDATGAVKINGAEEASGVYAHAAGLSAKATADHAIAIGHRAEASGSSSVAIGEIVEASSSRAMALGSNCSATAPGAIAIGTTVQANNWNSVAIGIGLISNYACQDVRGKYNAAGDYAEIVGNGASTNNRSNAYALTWDGDAHYALDTTAAAGTNDRALYAAITALGWESEVII